MSNAQRHPADDLLATVITELNMIKFNHCLVAGESRRLFLIKDAWTLVHQRGFDRRRRPRRIFE